MDGTSENLATYLDRIHSFLISENDSQFFPSLTKSMEDILINIAKDATSLRQDRFDGDCRSAAEKIIVLLNDKKQVFTLGYDLKFNPLWKKVLVYKKVPVPVFREPLLKPLRKPKLTPTEQTMMSAGSLMSSFKTTCLNSTLKFVKNDAQLVLQYPLMATEQADFVRQMLEQCLKRQRDTTGFKGLFDPLAEALAIFSLKYHFQLHSEEEGEMMRFKLEKTRKNPHDTIKEVLVTKRKLETDSDASSTIATPKALKKLTSLIDAMDRTTTTFKQRTIEQLSMFLRDRTATEHTFTNLSLPELQFVSHWQALTKRVEVMQRFGVEGQMVLDEIRESLKKKDYAVKLKLGMVTPDNRWAIFTKVPNANKPMSKKEKQAKLDAMQLPTMTAGYASRLETKSNSSISSRGSNSEPPKTYERRVDRFFYKTKDVKEEWIEDKLTLLKKFLQDESEASLIIPLVTDQQKTFLMKWQSLLTDPNVIESYTPVVQRLLKDISDAVSACKEKYRVYFGLSKVKNSKRDGRFSKVPVYSTRQPKQIPKENMPANIPPKPRDNNADNVLGNLDNMNNNTQYKALVENKTKVSTNKTEIVTSKNIQDTVQAESKQNSKLANIQNKLAKIALDKTSKRSPDIGGDKQNAATVKLIHGLNQPLVSEKGLKMMRQMGWVGGALGARGDGIVEPIQPSLEWGRRVGLGAPKPAPVKLKPPAPARNLPGAACVVTLPANGPSKAEIRKGLLQTVLKMVMEYRGGGRRTEINFSYKLSLKNWSYVKHIVTMFNNRSKVPNDPSELNLLTIEIMQRIPDDELMLTACWGVSRKNILLILSKFNEETNLDSNTWCSILTFEKTATKRNQLKLFINSPNDFKMKFDSDSCGNEAVKSDSSEPMMVDGEAFRSFVLSQIRDFCQNSNGDFDQRPQTRRIMKEVRLKGTMAPRQMSYIQDAVRRLNAGARCSSTGPHETALHDDITDAMKGKGYSLAVEFPNLGNSEDANMKPVYKIISLSKIFDRKKQDNNEIIKTSKGNVSVDAINKTFNNNSGETTTNSKFDTTNINLQQFSNNIAKNSDITKSISPEYIEIKSILNRNDKKHEFVENCQVDEDDDVVYVEVIDNEVIYVEDSDEEAILEPAQDENNLIPIINNVALPDTERESGDGELDGKSHGDYDKIEDCRLDLDDLCIYDVESTETEEASHDTTKEETVEGKENVETVNPIEYNDKANGCEENVYDDKINDVIDECVMNTSHSESKAVAWETDEENVSTKDMTETNEVTKSVSQDIENINDAASQVCKDTINESLKSVCIAETDNDKDSFRDDMVLPTDRFIIDTIDEDDRVSNTNESLDNIASEKCKDSVSVMVVDKEFDISIVDEKTPPKNNKNTTEISKDSKLDDLDKDIIHSECNESVNVANISVHDNLVGLNDVKSPGNIEGSHESNENKYQLANGKRSYALSSDRKHKRPKHDVIRHVDITPTDYPQTKMTNKMAAAVQKSLLKSIDYTQVLPLLKCHGIQNGALHYSCHNENSFKLVQSVVKTNDLKVTLTKEIEKVVYKMSFKINTFIDMSIESIFESLEDFNLSLSTKDWVFVKKEQYSDFIVVFVEMDVDSFKFIEAEHFKLYSGIDEAQFSLVWS